MNIRDGTERKVSSNARDELGDKIDKLTFMMSGLAAKDSNEKRPFKPQIYKSNGSHPQGQIRSYNQRGYQNRSRRQTVEIGDSMEIIGLDKGLETTSFERTLEDMEYKIIEESIGIIGAIIIIEAGID